MGIRDNIIRHESMMVSYSVRNGWTVVEVDGDVDIHTAGMIREAVSKLLDKGHSHFVLDLDFVAFMDSMGLGAVVGIMKRIRGQHGSMRIASASSRILRIFEISGLRENYEFFPSIEEATLSAPAFGNAA
jgi:anti-sigma B factor antagonist